MMPMTLHERSTWDRARRAAVARYLQQLAASGEDAAARAQATPASEKTASGAATGLRILIIEDNEDYADGLQTVFTIHGHQATVAYTGTDGLAAALEEVPEVVVCDIGLPGADGFEVARKLRANPATAAAYLVAVTGYGSVADQQAALASGFDAHLVKPVDASAILALLRTRRRPGAPS
jgi:CheY-like chemotaxis protein